MSVIGGKYIGKGQTVSLEFTFYAFLTDCLGLNITQRICELMGGTIVVKSKANEGS
jgi:hypothetical protein